MAQHRAAAPVGDSAMAADFAASAVAGASADVAVASRHTSDPRRYHRSRAGKPSWGGLLVRALPILLLATGCSIGTTDVGVVPVTIRTLPPLDVEANLTEQPSDPRAELIAALSATQGSYGYETTVMIDGSVMMLVTGEVTGAVEESRVARGESVLEYRRTADGHWVLGPADQFLPIDRITTGTAPLDGLAGSAALNVDHDGDDDSVLQAVYSGGAIGVPEVDEVSVRVTIRNGMVSRVRYDVPVEGVTARVVTVISAGELVRQGTGQDVRAAE